MKNLIIELSEYRMLFFPRYSKAMDVISEIDDERSVYMFLKWFSTTGRKHLIINKKSDTSRLEMLLETDLELVKELIEGFFDKYSEDSAKFYKIANQYLNEYSK